MTKQPLNILVVSASGRIDGSVSRQLTQDFLSALKEDVDINVTERDLADGLPFVDQNWINANFTPAEDRTADQTATLSFSDGLVDELKAADLVVIGAPVYNFGVPASLKAWIDQVARARLTFQYTENGPVGLLTSKRAVIVTVSGGTEVGSDIDFATGYLRHILGFLGIHDVAQINADRMMIDAGAALEKAKAQIGDAVAEISRNKARAA